MTKNNQQPKMEWEEEYYRLINPYRDVLDDSSVETLKARFESILSQQRGKIIRELDKKYNALCEQKVKEADIER